MVFLETETVRLISQMRNIWDPRSALPADFPTGISALRVPRAVNTHALVFPLRHTAPSTPLSFPENMHAPKRIVQRLNRLLNGALCRFS